MKTKRQKNAADLGGDPDKEARLRELLRIAGWYVHFFWEETPDRGHREKAWEHLLQIEAEVGPI